jgi:sodium/potassium-transporting ATPase subunit alpha
MPFPTRMQPLSHPKTCKSRFLWINQVHPTDTCRLLTIKGAPDVLIDRCSKYVSMDGESRTLDQNTRQAIERKKDYWSSQGKRVILLARKALFKDNIRSQPSSSHFESEVMDHARSGLTLIGLVGIVDPPRDEIPSVIRVLRGAGIRIFMVSPHQYQSGAILITELGHRRFRFDCPSNCRRMRDHH